MKASELIQDKENKARKMPSMSTEKYAYALRSKLMHELDINVVPETKFEDNVLTLSLKFGNVPMKVRMQFILKDNKTLQAVACSIIIDQQYTTDVLQSIGYPIGVSVDKLIETLKKYKKYLSENKIVSVKTSNDERIFKCCICGKVVKGYGNNPAPVKEEGKCCDECNIEYVIPERLKRLDK